MGRKKTSSFSFVEDGKENIQARLKQLIGGWSLRQAAIAWGLPYSTLNNYFEKCARPGVNVVAKICQVENVSIEWLVFGTQPEQPASTLDEPLQRLTAILTSLESEELKSLTKLLGRKGADVLVRLLEDGSLDLLNLTSYRREAALMLENMSDKEVREILRELKQCNTLPEEVDYKHQASA
ncbi:MAG: helix-turn-helix domain-containing protein [Sodalis sp. (in: enterobacteria)]|uniref:helix-turn-helix domain-containing protein n=1 Tax=Sodalis sp. (in: enterobacteria) TaxID=1898979 RepID=UPI0039E34529